MKYISAFIISVLFMVAQPVGWVLGLLGLLIGDTTYLSHIVRAQDRSTAAILGWDGNATVSKECGRSTCRFCKIICAILNKVLEPNHCKKEAADE